jgi:hypothetical protein
MHSVKRHQLSVGFRKVLLLSIILILCAVKSAYADWWGHSYLFDAYVWLGVIGILYVVNIGYVFRPISVQTGGIFSRFILVMNSFWVVATIVSWMKSSSRSDANGTEIAFALLFNAIFFLNIVRSAKSLMQASLKREDSE